jgi:hypothetical protein
VDGLDVRKENESISHYSSTWLRSRSYALFYEHTFWTRGFEGDSMVDLAILLRRWFDSRIYGYTTRRQTLVVVFVCDISHWDTLPRCKNRIHNQEWRYGASRRHGISYGIHSRMAFYHNLNFYAWSDIRCVEHDSSKIDIPEDSQFWTRKPRMRTSRVMTTTTSRPVSMIFRNSTINPVIDVRPRW